jgi:hypothetical protein
VRIDLGRLLKLLQGIGELSVRCEVLALLGERRRLLKREAIPAKLEFVAPVGKARNLVEF